MHRKMFLAVVFMFLCFPAGALAQDMVLPGPGAVLELRSDDARCSEGFRCFLAGRNASYRDMLDRVNADIEDPEMHVSVQQMESANQCRFIYVREDGSMMRNGSCSRNNGTDERVTWQQFCAGRQCQRWILATYNAAHPTVYRIPAERRLTPGEEAERIRQEVEVASTSEPRPGQAWFGQRVRRLIDLQREEQPPTTEQFESAMGSIAAALMSAPMSTVPAVSIEARPIVHPPAPELSPAAPRAPPLASESPEPADSQDEPFTEPADVGGIPAVSSTPVQQPPDAPSADGASGNTQQPLPPDRATQRSSSSPYLLLGLLAVIVVLGAVILLQRRRIRRLERGHMPRILELEEAVEKNARVLKVTNDALEAATHEREQWKERFGALDTVEFHRCWREETGSSEPLTPELLKRKLVLAREALALSSMWNGRGELNADAFREVCDKADRYDALVRVWKKVDESTELTPFALHAYVQSPAVVEPVLETHSPQEEDLDQLREKAHRYDELDRTWKDIVVREWNEQPGSNKPVLTLSPWSLKTYLDCVERFDEEQRHEAEKRLRTLYEQQMSGAQDAHGKTLQRLMKFLGERDASVKELAQALKNARDELVAAEGRYADFSSNVRSTVESWLFPLSRIAELATPYTTEDFENCHALTRFHRIRLFMAELQERIDELAGPVHHFLQELARPALVLAPAEASAVLAALPVEFRDLMRSDSDEADSAPLPPEKTQPFARRKSGLALP